jgi:hypothetical protein
MGKRYIHGVEVIVRTKPLASDSYKKYPCETPGCKHMITGHRGDEGWVSAWKVRKARIERYGAALCNTCRDKREDELHPKSPEELAEGKRYWDERNARFETLTVQDIMDGRF